MTNEFDESYSDDFAAAYPVVPLRDVVVFPSMTTAILVGRQPSVNAVERAIEDNVPAEFQQHAHHWLILHGRYTCLARRPRCGSCVIEDLCEYRAKTVTTD